MSFDFNPIGNLSNVQASSKTTQGGGGNTGYFKREEEDEEFNFKKTKDYPEDSFEKTEEIIGEIQEQSFLTILKNLLLDFLNWLKSLFS